MKEIRVYLIFSAVLMVFYLIAEYYRPVPTNWKATYLKEDKIPFGLYILHQQIPHLFPDAELKIERSRIYNTLHGVNYKNAAYVFLAAEIKMDPLDYTELKKFMKAGNQVFIAAYNPGEILKDSLKLGVSSNDVIITGKGTAINFTNPRLKAGKPYVFEKGIGEGFYDEVDSSRIVSLGRNENKEINFVKYPFGKGNLYLMANPQLFSNYSLLNPRGAEYAGKALSYLQNPDVILWDELNTAGVGGNQSPLALLFRYSSLSWAYYLSMAAILLFVLFEMKRRQRIIPVIEPLTNSSAAFVKLIAQVYYQKQDNKDIALKKINFFMEYLRVRFHLRAQVLNQDLKDLLSAKSGIPAEELIPLITILETIEKSPNVSDQKLIELNNRIEMFYQQMAS
jgi:hypothetical protein